MTTTPPRNFPRSVDAAIFDFDETLINLEPQHTAACERLCRALGDDYASVPESFRDASGKRVIDDVRWLRHFFGWTRSVDDLFAQRQRYFDDECRRGALELMPGAEGILRALGRSGVPLAITSSAVRSSIEAILRRFGLRELFAVIVDGSEVARGKPDPEAYLLTASKLQVDPRRCVVFEDSAVGVASAKAAGTFCIAVRNPAAKTRQDLSGADLEADSLEEIDPRWFATSSRTPR